VTLGQLTGLVLAAAIGLTPIAPPEHVHEAGDPDHHSTLVHRHAAAHGAHRHAGDHGLAFDDDDAAVVMLPALLVPPAAPLALAAPPSRPLLRVEPPLSPRVPMAEYVELLIHGPPRAPASLRAPPSSPAL
jgi:hypothetical protein